MAHNVVVNGDATLELDETLTGSIGGLSAGGRNVSLGAGTATGTVLNDDVDTTPPVLSGWTLADDTGVSPTDKLTQGHHPDVDVDLLRSHQRPE